LFYGYPVKRKPVKGKVKRYDEITGKPYYTELITHYVMKYKDREIMRTDTDNLGDLFDDSFIFIRNFEDDNMFWIGKKLVEPVVSYGDRPHFEVENFNIPEVDKLEEIFGDKPKVYLMMDVY